MYISQFPAPSSSPSHLHATSFCLFISEIPPNTHVTNDIFLPSSFLFVCVQSVSSNPIYPKFITSFIRKS